MDSRWLWCTGLDEFGRHGKVRRFPAFAEVERDGWAGWGKVAKVRIAGSPRFGVLSTKEEVCGLMRLNRERAAQNSLDGLQD